MCCFQEASRQSSSLKIKIHSSIINFPAAVQETSVFVRTCTIIFFLFFFVLRLFQNFFVIQWKECKVIMYSYVCLETFATPSSTSWGQIKWDLEGGLKRRRLCAVSSRYCLRAESVHSRLSCAEFYIFEKKHDIGEQAFLYFFVFFKCLRFSKCYLEKKNALTILSIRPISRIGVNVLPNLGERGLRKRRTCYSR